MSLAPEQDRKAAQAELVRKLPNANAPRLFLLLFTREWNEA